jgi:hypothetical protein
MDMLINPGKSVCRLGKVNVIDMPVSDLAGHLREAALNHCAVFCFLQGDHKRYAVEINEGTRYRESFCSLRLDCVRFESFEGKSGDWSNIVWRGPFGQPPGERPPIQVQAFRTMIEKFLGIPAPIIVASAEKEDSVGPHLSRHVLIHDRGRLGMFARFHKVVEQMLQWIG